MMEELAKKQKQLLDWEADAKHTWCSGCGNYGILNAVTSAMVLEDIEPHKAVFAFDVGCHGNLSDKVKSNTIHGLHGRVLPLAAGITIANPDLEVITFSGDGGLLSEGLSHFYHACRSNYNMTLILHKNESFALTTGQVNASTDSNIHKKQNTSYTAPSMSALSIALNAGCGFVARGYTGNVEELTKIMQNALQYKGFSVVEVIQICPKYNPEHGEDWFDKTAVNIRTLKNYDSHNLWHAIQISQSNPNVVGVLYEAEKTDFLANQTSRKNIKTNLVDEVKTTDITKFLDRLK